MSKNSTSKQNITSTLSSFTILPDCAFINIEIVCSLYGLSRATIWRKVKARTMPQPVKVSERRTAWQIADIRADLAKKLGNTND